MIVLTCKDFRTPCNEVLTRLFISDCHYVNATKEDMSARDLYIFYVPMSDVISDDSPIPALKKCQSEFGKSFSNRDSDIYVRIQKRRVGYFTNCKNNR